MTTSLKDVGLAVKRLQWCHHREGNRRLAPVGLSLVQWDVLRHLSLEPDASLHRLAVLTFQTDQAMGELARRMVDRGLLRREAGPGRIVQHRHTDDGEQALAAGADVLDTVLDETIGALTSHERTELLRLLTKAGSA
ncbi:MarR family winged helix-turn-helix transcriptional regulator [Glaciibacter superstes]|uniref:MarR family winged helix-turn-helix transcriptional regulator n=1 Tax=Glaciibacter superstes TaxID=501023 RepID=UPI0003B35391|nr:MarR family winged helix-turn-helix transcriptional regulator [Glaciibacter superstes]